MPFKTAHILKFAFLVSVLAGALASVAAAQADYLPLQVGRQWVLRLPASPSAVVFTVTGENGGVYSVDFDNPWIKSVLELRPQGDKVVITGVTINGQHSALPANTVYWDFGAAHNATWQNSIGSMTIVSRTKTVRAPAGRFNNCIEIRETNHQGNQNYWVFAPRVGFVQFGEDKVAFLLDRTSEGAASRTQPPPPATTPAPAITSGLRIGLSVNPFATEKYDGSSIEPHFKQAVAAGISIVYISPKWNEIEPKASEYRFDSVDADIERAVRNNVPVVCDFRVIDTNQRAMPTDLQKKDFDDREVHARLLAALDALAPHFRGRVRWLMIGNEIDPYFGGHSREVSAYARLFGDGAQHAKQLVPGLMVSATATVGGLNQINGLLRPIYSQSDFVGLTYYPLNADFTVRGPDTVASDFARMVEAAAGKPILLQEVGYPSSTRNNSSDSQQAQFFQQVFDSLRRYRNNFIAANFFLMADFPDWLVDQFSRYYGSNAERFRSYLKTLGVFDDQGRPKPSWKVFQQNARSVQGM